MTFLTRSVSGAASVSFVGGQCALLSVRYFFNIINPTRIQGECDASMLPHYRERFRGCAARPAGVRCQCTAAWSVGGLDQARAGRRDHAVGNAHALHHRKASERTRHAAERRRQRRPCGPQLQVCRLAENAGRCDVAAAMHRAARRRTNRPLRLRHRPAFHRHLQHLGERSRPRTDIGPYNRGTSHR